MNKVRAIIFYEHGVPEKVTRVEEIEIEPPKSGEALVRMIAAPIHPSDLNLIEGKYPIHPVLPAIAGSEGAGVVEEIGEGVNGVAPGDLVLLPRSFGTWREAGVVGAEELVVVPHGIEPLQAAMLRVNPATAFRMLRDFVELQPGDFVVQNAGNSAVGRAVIQIAHACGWRTISLVRRASLIDELKSIGADFVFLDDEDAAPRIELAAVGRPCSLALNAVGGESALRLANALASGGTIVTYGAMSRQPLRIPNGLLIFKDLRFRGFWITPRRQRATSEESTAMINELFALARRGVLRQPVERVYALDSIREAIEHAQRSGRGGKILMGFETPALA
jgi:trans-2-enoyl-CoA reductase